MDSPVPFMMENPNQPVSHPIPLSTQGYSHQMQPAMWAGNKNCQSNSNQNANVDPYSQQISHYYQAPYSAQTSNEMNRYIPSTPKDQMSNSVGQYSVPRQNNYTCSTPAPSYPVAVKSNYSNQLYYGNMNASKNYPVQPKKYATTSLGLSQAPPAVPQSSLATPMPQMPNYGDQNNYMQNMYSNCNGENPSYMMRQTVSMLSSQENSSIRAGSMSQVNQVSSIPTPPETSSLPCDTLPMLENSSPDASTDSAKITFSSSSFGSSSRGASLALVDEGSQASSASASSSLPDEQSPAKSSSKPNFSYPPTPNTLSSPGAASMSSFHDDLECISSPGWPKTPASPVANSSYEFANIKRPENLLKLYTLSDEPDRRYFLDKLIVFNEDRGSPITQCPTISKQPLDVFRVYLTVKERGGFVEVTNAKRWKDIAGAIGVGASSSAAYTLRKQYMKLLLPFECKFDRGGIDPQPIISMVEASSRKKGKNTVGTYGNPNPYNQGYSQAMDRYHSGYPSSYQSSRYPCSNNVNYQCATSSIHYSQSVTHSAPPPNASSQGQYNQYSPMNSLTNYGYYQDNNNSASTQAYSNNLQNGSSSNICRYRSSSSAVPQEQGYYSQQYSASHHENTYSSNRICNTQENLTPNDIEQQQPSTYPKVASAVNGASRTVAENSISHPKAGSDGFGNINSNCISMSTSNFSASQDTKTYCGNYGVANKTATSEQTSVISSNCALTPAISQTYQQPLSESKTPELNFHSSPVSNSTDNHSNSIQSSYLNRNSYSNQKMGDQALSSHYGQYSETPNESYTGSEGPPSVQVDRRLISTTDASAVNAKVFPYNTTAYNCSVPQGTKDIYNASNYNSQFNSGPQRSNSSWHPEQNQYSYQAHHVGPRIPLKPHVNSLEMKQNSESSHVRKPWMNPRDSPSAQNKPQNITLQSQTPSTCKPQLPPNSMTVSQAFQSMVKRPIEFPPNCVESVKPVAVKRRRCPAKRLGSIDPWRIMLALKSGLLAESTWALDVLSILLADNNTVMYFGLSHLPGLLNVLVDYYRCFLNKIFHLVNDVEIEQTEESDKSHNDLSYLSINEVSDLESKIKVLNSPNFTYKTRCKKKVEIQYDEALFLIDPLRSWDKFEGFHVTPEHWLKGGGDITTHIQSCFDNSSKKIKFCKELSSEDKIKHKNSKISVVVKSLHPVLGNKCNLSKSPGFKGEPVVVLQKFNFLANKISSDGESDNNDACSLSSSNCIKKISENIALKKEDSVDSCELKALDKVNTYVSDSSIFENSLVPDEKKVKLKSEETNESQHLSDSETCKNFPQLRGSISSRKRFLCEDLEDEAYCYDQPALSVVSDSQEMLSRRCVCVSTILRNLSFVPGNDSIMGKNSGVLLLLGRLLLLHHEHKPTKNSYRKYEKEIDGNVNWNESCISLKEEHEWWWATLSVLRDNTLVILSNISGQLDLAPFPEEVSLPILDGLLHWIICPSSYAQDPLPSRSPSSVLSPQRLSLEALCKLSVLSSNVDLIVATPPWSRIENLLSFLTKSLSHGQDQIMREFAVILLSNISQADSVAARTIAEQSHCISYLIAFIEEAEANAFQIAISQGTKKLRDKPELMGTTPGMVQRAAKTLKNLALVPENQGLFVRYQSRLLSLVMSQVMDQELATVIADVLFYCSEDAVDVTSQLSVS